MSAHWWIHFLVTITLIEMAAAIGLSVPLADVARAARHWEVVWRAGLANYIAVPAVTVALLVAFRVSQPTAIALLILAACPGSTYGPPLTAMARGNAALSVGQMVLLAGSSPILAPVVLYVALPLVSSESNLTFDILELTGTLLATQLLPLCLGLALRHWSPDLAARLQKPANGLAKALNVLAAVVILSTEHGTLAQIRPVEFLVMCLLLAASLAAGYLLAGASGDDRKAGALTASLRNVGISLVIGSGHSAGTRVLSAILVYTVVELVGSLVGALWWRWSVRVIHAPQTGSFFRVRSGQSP